MASTSGSLRPEALGFRLEDGFLKPTQHYSPKGSMYPRIRYLGLGL